MKVMEDQNNTLCKRFFGDSGKASVTDSSRLDILNPDKLKLLIGEGVYKTKIKENVKTDYKVDAKTGARAKRQSFRRITRLNRALMNSCRGWIRHRTGHSAVSLPKKLKGDYEKRPRRADRNAEAAGGCRSGCGAVVHL